MTNPWMIMLLGIITVFVWCYSIILFLLGFPGFSVPSNAESMESLLRFPRLLG